MRQGQGKPGFAVSLLPWLFWGPVSSEPCGSSSPLTRELMETAATVLIRAGFGGVCFFVNKPFLHYLLETET